MRIEGALKANPPAWGVSMDGEARPAWTMSGIRGLARAWQPSPAAGTSGTDTCHSGSGHLASLWKPPLRPWQQSARKGETEPRPAESRSFQKCSRNPCQLLMGAVAIFQDIHCSPINTGTLPEQCRSGYQLCHSGLSRETEPLGCLYVHIRKEIYYKELGPVIMEAGEAQDLQA